MGGCREGGSAWSIHIYIYIIYLLIYPSIYLSTHINVVFKHTKARLQNRTSPFSSQETDHCCGHCAEDSHHASGRRNGPPSASEMRRVTTYMIFPHAYRWLIDVDTRYSQMNLPHLWEGCESKG